MNIKVLAFLAIPTFSTITANAQELTSKIPKDAQFVVSINSKAIVEHSSMELLNETLTKLGAFDKQATDGVNYMPENLIESDIDLDRQAFIYRTSNDSLYYVGILLPLKANQQVGQKMFPNFQELPETKGYQRRVSSDGKTHAAWNDESVLVLTGDLHSDYFDNVAIANRYNIELDNATTSTWNNDYSGTDAYVLADSADATWTEIDFDEDTVTAPVDSVSAWESATPDTVTTDTLEDVEDYVDAAPEDDVSYLWDDEPDSSTLAYQAREAKNDSIKNELLINWLSQDFTDYLEPADNLAKNKSVRLKDNKHLIRVWISNLDELYSDALPYDIVKIAYGVDMKNLKYGYQSATLDLIQDKHNIKIQGTAQLDVETARIFDGIYSNKMNKKFKQYIPENHLAYGSVNISTEGYLKQLPGLISRWYAPLLGENGEFLKLAATALEIGLDEKAIGNIKRGDDVFFLNDLRKVEKEYITYEYDENYEYQEVTKTKDQYVPSFLWMFTSKDHRLFKKILDLGINKQEVTLDDDIYTIEKPNNMDPIYIYFKKDIVFVGSDAEQISAIQENRFKSSRNAKVKKDIFSNQLNLIVHASEIPEAVRQLEIPVTASWEQTLQDLSTYGDLQLKSNMKGKNGVYGEVSIELPKADKNALQYVLKHVIENLDGSIEN
ncbi:hypothetical protein HP439_10690 [Sphingobacterium shayense]|uniref:hypothetical protein n=1 Tax=Sphingobacterium shayense TaxID=626343 RepID=UPI001556A534|nr:hypothetical protein [Sphingobacterium shayense]NQD71188.1 hypothetical protein [Sphingobacterium shayense]